MEKYTYKDFLPESVVRVINFAERAGKFVVDLIEAHTPVPPQPTHYQETMFQQEDGGEALVPRPTHFDEESLWWDERGYPHPGSRDDS